MGYRSRRAHKHPPQDFSKVYNEIPPRSVHRSNWFRRRLNALKGDTGIDALEKGELIGFTVLWGTLAAAIAYKVCKQKQLASS